MYFDLEDLDPDVVYQRLTQIVLPRPVAWVLSENASGGLNLAPFSYFNAVCSDPPLIMLSIGRRIDGRPKDTCVNIAERHDFVVHIAHRELLDALNASSASLPPEDSEVDRLGLALAAFEGARLPRLADCRIALDCTRYEIREIGNLPQALILGLGRRVYVADSACGFDSKNRFKVSAQQVDPIGRLGAAEYVTFGELRRLRRPD